MLGENCQAIKSAATLVTRVDWILKIFQAAMMQSIQICRRCTINIFWLNVQITHVNIFHVGDGLFRVAFVAKALTAVNNMSLQVITKSGLIGKPAPTEEADLLLLLRVRRNDRPYGPFMSQSCHF